MAVKDRVADIVEQFKIEFPKVFRESAQGFIEEFTANLVLKPGTIPVFHKAYPLPYSVRDLVCAELLKMERLGRLVRVTYSDWASPIWPVAKSVGIRVCIDPSRTVNPSLMSAVYPLPLIDDLMQAGAGKSCYVLLDLYEAYQQLKVAPESRKLLTINTPLGLRVIPVCLSTIWNILWPSNIPICH